MTRSQLVEGRIRPPASLPAAMARLRVCVSEVRRIEAQLNDPQRSLETPRPEYTQWRKKARTALQYLSSESEQLSLWIEEHPESALLRDVHTLLCRLREEVDLDPDEAAVIVRLDALYGRVAAPVK